MCLKDLGINPNKILRLGKKSPKLGKYRLFLHVPIQRGDRGSGPPEKSQHFVFYSNTGHHNILFFLAILVQNL